MELLLIDKLLLFFVSLAGRRFRWLALRDLRHLHAWVQLRVNQDATCTVIIKLHVWTVAAMTAVSRGAAQVSTETFVQWAISAHLVRQLAELTS